MSVTSDGGRLSYLNATTGYVATTCSTSMPHLFFDFSSSWGVLGLFLRNTDFYTNHPKTKN